MNQYRNKSVMKFIKFSGTILFVMYISYLIYLTFLDPLYGRGSIRRSINIIPLKTIIQFLTSSYNRNVIVTNIAGNIAAFMPMGFLLPVAFTGLNKFIRVLVAVLTATVSIEVFQYITGVGAADIDDIILNVLGGVLGYLMYIVFMRALANLPCVKKGDQE